MNRLTTLFLLLLVGGLGFVVYRQSQREAAIPTADAEPLFRGVDPALVRAIRLENLERSIHARIERDDNGVWYLTDPIAYPAAPEVVEQVLMIISANLATPVPTELQDRAAAGLAPARGFIEVEEEQVGGGRRKVRVEMGAVDLDGQRVFVQRDGRVLRTMRNLESLLQRDIPDLRSRRLFRVDPSSVVALDRRGRVFLEGSAPSADWSVAAEGYGWRMYKPVRGRIDADFMGLYSRAIASLRITRFVTDVPDADLARYGLAPAWFSIRLQDGHGIESTLEFGQSDDRRSFARRPGQPHVYELGANEWNTIVEGIDNLGELMEREFFRLRRDMLQDVTFERRGAALRLARGIDGSWSVAERPAGMAEFGLPVPAESSAVEEVLTRLETQAKLTVLLDRPVEDGFPAGEPRDAIWVTPVGDRRQGGFCGRRIRGAEGTELLAFLREDEAVLAGLDVAIEELLDLPASHFYRRLVWDVAEAFLSELSITHAGRTRRYVRSEAFTWRPSDAEVPARELRQLLDAVLFLKADTEVRPADRAELTDVLRLELVDMDRQRLVADLGRAPDGTIELTHGTRRAKALDQGLHAKLAALVEGGQ